MGKYRNASEVIDVRRSNPRRDKYHFDCVCITPTASTRNVYEYVPSIEQYSQPRDDTVSIGTLDYGNGTTSSSGGDAFVIMYNPAADVDLNLKKLAVLIQTTTAGTLTTASLITVRLFDVTNLVNSDLTLIRPTAGLTNATAVTFDKIPWNTASNPATVSLAATLPLAAAKGSMMEFEEFAYDANEERVAKLSSSNVYAIVIGVTRNASETGILKLWGANSAPSSSQSILYYSDNVGWNGLLSLDVSGATGIEEPTWNIGAARSVDIDFIRCVSGTAMNDVIFRAEAVTHDEIQVDSGRYVIRKSGLSLRNMEHELQRPVILERYQKFKFSYTTPSGFTAMLRTVFGVHHG